MRAGAVVSIGGGSTGSRRPVTTTAIDREAIRLTGKKSPNVLFLPTAGRDTPSKVTAFTTHYESLGCTVKPLWLYEQKNVSPSSRSATGRREIPTEQRDFSRATRNDMQAIRDLIDWADLIYVGGGNPIRMMNRWRAFGVDQLLVQAHRDGKVLAGMSAGAICWFQFGLTDCWRKDHDASRALVCRGLNLIPGMCNPHYHTESWRIPRARTVIRKDPTLEVGVGIDDNAALIVEGDRFRVVVSDPTAWVYRSFWKNSQFFEERLAEYGFLAILTKRS